jgi:hypothetical protein
MRCDSVEQGRAIWKSPHRLQAATIRKKGETRRKRREQSDAQYETGKESKEAQTMSMNLARFTAEKK